jgi:hypothetical protein
VANAALDALVPGLLTTYMLPVSLPVLSGNALYMALSLVEFKLLYVTSTSYNAGQLDMLMADNAALENM